MPVKNEDEAFSLCFVYALNTKPRQSKQWVQLRSWEIESVEGQFQHVVVDVNHKSDHVNTLLHSLKHSFSKFINLENKTKAFEASWAANIVAARNAWIACGSLPKERKIAKVPALSWKVSQHPSSCIWMAIHIHDLHNSFLCYRQTVVCLYKCTFSLHTLIVCSRNFATPWWTRFRQWTWNPQPRKQSKS